MTRPSPAAVLNGVQCGHICDRCNRGIETGDKAVVYATYYDADDELFVAYGATTAEARPSACRLMTRLQLSLRASIGKGGQSA